MFVFPYHKFLGSVIRGLAEASAMATGSKNNNQQPGIRIIGRRERNSVDRVQLINCSGKPPPPKTSLDEQAP